MLNYKKSFFKDKVEPFFYEKMEDDNYDVARIDAVNLLTWNRLDLAFKLFYLDMKDKNKNLAQTIYKEDIRCQTSGEFQEFGNKNKNSFDAYINEFNSIYYSIKDNGFDDTKSIVPLSKSKTIENGAHRVAAAIQLNKSVTCAYFNLPVSTCDYTFYYNRKVSTDILNSVVTKFIEYTNNTYIAFLWPSGKDNTKESEACFSKIVYKTKISLNSNGAFGLLHELYKHMDWIGSTANSFNGIQQKLVECFPDFESFTVIVFQSESIEEVRKIKENVRKIHNIGFSSVHITDTKEEAIRISRLIFNDNGLHFLNYSNPNKYSSTDEKLKEFKEFVKKNTLKENDIILDTGSVMSIYGIRESNDIDYFVNDNNNIKFEYDEIECHDNELEYHDEEKTELIYNPKFYFYFENIKFISFNQVHRMKKNRGGQKDMNDIDMMDAFIENNIIKKIKTTIMQHVLYTKVKIRKSMIDLLKTLRIYEASKNFYDKKYVNIKR